MSNKKEFTEEEQSVVNKTWSKGRCPDQCIGQCYIYGIEIAECKNCSWDDGYIPVSSEPYKI